MPDMPGISEKERTGARDMFLSAHGWSPATARPMVNDCSFRRYFRLEDGERRAILMDAPPDKEDVRPFVTVGRRLEGWGYSAPRIHAEDPAAGFLILDDFGNTTFTRALSEGADEESLYMPALDLLIDLHSRAVDEVAGTVPPYDDATLLREAALFTDVHLRRWHGCEISDAAREAFLHCIRTAMAESRIGNEVLVLRDYHVDNMMVLRDREGLKSIGLLDFQDAVTGPAAYDVVSLTQDARRDLSAGLEEKLVQRYLAARPDLDGGAYWRSHALLGAQRSLKIFGIFTRQALDYGRDLYLCHLGRLWQYVDTDLRIADSAGRALADWLKHHVPDELKDADAQGRRLTEIS